MTQPETNTYPYRPFQPERIHTLDPAAVPELEKNIWVMGNNDKPVDYTDGVKPLRVEEEFVWHERHALATNNATPTYWDVQTNEPRVILVTADGDDIFIDFNRQISTDSPKVFNKSSLSTTARGLTRIWAQNVTVASAVLRIVVLKR
jgi:hypothetical protein